MNHELVNDIIVYVDVMESDNGDRICHWPGMTATSPGINKMVAVPFAGLYCQRKSFGLTGTAPGALNTNLHSPVGISANNAKTDTMKIHSILSCIISVGLGAVSLPVRV